MPSRSDPLVIQTLKDYRLSLIAREDNQIERLAKEWIQIENSLHDEMLLLAMQINEEKLKGSAITEQLIARMDRYKQLDAQMKQQILSFAKDTAVPDIESEQREYGLTALQMTNDVINMQFQFGIQFNTLSKDAVETYVGILGDGSPLYKLLKEAYPDSLDGIVKALLEGTSKGLNPNQVAYNMSKSMGIGLDRITLIARTEQLRVNRLVSAQQYRESGLDGVMKRVATKDSETCMACLMLDGEIIELDGELDDHPRGRCEAIFQVKGSPEVEWQSGKDWFESQDDDTQKYMMGEQKWNLWQDGIFDLSAIAKKDSNDIWGDNPRPATIQELTQ